MKFHKRKTIKGKLNALIDDFLHPYFDKPIFVVVDGILHALVEQNPEESIKKFMRYNGDKLIKSIIKKVLENAKT